MKIKIEEFVKTNSIYSSMRLAFIWMVRVVIGLSIFFSISFVAAAFVSPFIPKAVELPVGAMIGLIGSLSAVAFGGKAFQSFSEPNDPPIEGEETLEPK